MLKFKLIHIFIVNCTVPSTTVDTFRCYHWTIYQEFDFSERNILVLKIRADKSYCDSSYSETNFWSRYMWLYVICMLLSLISVFLNLKYIYDIFESFNLMKEKYTKLKSSKAKRNYKTKISKIRISNKNFKTRRTKSNYFALNRSSEPHTISFNPSPNENEKEVALESVPMPNLNFGRRETMYSENKVYDAKQSLDEEIPSWEKLTFNDKAMLFSYWVIAIIFTNIVVLIGCVLKLFNTRDINQKGDGILGFGGLLLWITLLRYYEHTRGYNIVLTTFQNSSGIVFKALAGILPVFIGFGLFGMCLFWNSKRFMSFGASVFSLFALMNGDMIFDAYHDLDSINYFWSQIYLYLFIAIAILVIQNVFIAIIEDGYQISKYKEKKDWLKHGFNDDIQIPSLHNQYINDTPEPGSPSKSSLKKNQAVTQANPFAKLQKHRKKDQKSRETLIKMLWHDKVTYYNDGINGNSLLNQNRIDRVGMIMESENTGSKRENRVTFDTGFAEASAEKQKLSSKEKEILHSTLSIPPLFSPNHEFQKIFVFENFV